MPWKRTDPMEGRMRLVMEVESEVFQMSELCERYGVSRKTGYKCEVAPVSRAAWRFI